MKFHGYFRDGAVLQRGVPVTVTGYAEGEVRCSLSCGDRLTERNVRSGGGIFRVTFPPVSDTRGEYILAAACGGERISVRVRFGDVYLAAGQSNMSYSLGSVEDSELWAERAARLPVSVLELAEPPFRSLSELVRPPLPCGDFVREYAWRSGKELSGCSALAVQTAVFLSETRGVPVGVVQTAMGGLSVEAYLRREDVEADGELVSFLKDAGRYQSLEEYNRAGERNYSQLAGVWNEKIAPLKDVRFAGVMWLLGESSAFDFRYAQMFEREMGLLIGALEELFGAPFVCVHIAPEYYPYGDRFGYLYINEALTRTELLREDVVAVPVYDIEPRWLKADGETYYHPIHPVNKAPVAERIARAFGGGGRYPRICGVRFEEGRAVCRVSHAGEGMREGEIEGFTLAGEDGKYYPARARTVAPDRIEVVSDEVPSPRAVTYAFMQYQDFCNGRRKDGAPLLPFRTRREPVNGGYFFPPAYTTAGAGEVYESCFGWQAGTCRKRSVWTKGEIYGAGEVVLEVLKDGLSCRAFPCAESFFLFGFSPAICLSGHRNHLADFAFLNFSLSAEGDAEFLGVVCRAVDGEVFRFALMDGEEKADAVELTREPRRIAVALGEGTRGDSAPVSFPPEMRRNFVQAEFLFRAKAPVTVKLSGLTLSDVNRSQGGGRREAGEERADAVLPQTES